MLVGQLVLAAAAARVNKLTLLLGACFARFKVKCKTTLPILSEIELEVNLANISNTR